MVSVAPSVLSADFTDLKRELAATEEAGADLLHVDVMDGRFVPNITIGPFIVEHLKRITKLPLDVHLMIEEPGRYVADFVKAGAVIVTVHYEAERHLHKTISAIRELGVKAGVSINPGTPVNVLDAILPYVDLVLIMSVNPGFGGQSFIPGSERKLMALREKMRQLDVTATVEIDGGIGPKNAKDVIAAGAEMIVMGSAFYKSADYGETVRAVKSGQRG